MILQQKNNSSILKYPSGMNWSNVILKTREMVKEIMSKYDASHDFNHVERVVSLSKRIAQMENVKDLDKLQVIELAAYLHDVHDHKYDSSTGEQRERAISEHLSSLNVPKDLIDRVQYVVDNISFSKEVKRIKENQQLRDEDLCVEIKVVSHFQFFQLQTLPRYKTVTDWMPLVPLVLLVV